MLVIALLLSAALNAAPIVPPSFVAPKGWTQGKDLPAGGPDAVWLSPRFGKNGNGENLAVTSHPITAGTTLASEVRGAIREMSEDRAVSGSHSEPTCHGKQPGWVFEGRLALPNGIRLSQLYHIAIANGRAYMFVFTHKTGDAVEAAITNSIQSICP